MIAKIVICIVTVISIFTLIDYKSKKYKNILEEYENNYSNEELNAFIEEETQKFQQINLSKQEKIQVKTAIKFWNDVLQLKKKKIYEDWKKDEEMFL